MFKFMFKSRTKLTCLIVFIWFFWIAAASAQNPVGELLLNRGIVKVRHNGQEVIIREKGQTHPVFEGDTVQSGKRTRAKISFGGNNETVNIFARTHFKVTEVRPKRTFLGLNLGKAIFGVLAKKIFKVRTPTATIGVKGTEFVVGTTGNTTFVLTLKGVVGLTSIALPDIEVIVLPNQAVSVEKNQAPTPPVVVPPAQQEEIITSDSTAEFEQLEFQEPPPIEEPKEEGEGEAAAAAEGEQPAEEGAPAESEESAPADSSTVTVSATADAELAAITAVVGTVTETIDAVNKTVEEVTEDVAQEEIVVPEITQDAPVRVIITR